MSHSLPDSIDERRFEFKSDRAYKFWAITLALRSVAIHYGRIGSRGQTREYQFPDVAAAKEDYVKRIREKQRDGYREYQRNPVPDVTADQMWDELAEHEPFVMGILDDPDDLAGYWIYSDWLSEQNDPRGRFMQLQLQLEDAATPLYRRPQLEKEVKQLRVRHARTWLGSLAKTLMSTEGMLVSNGYDFYRGHLGSICIYQFSLEVGTLLKASPHCRMLRKLSIQNTVSLENDVVIEGRTYSSGRDHGLASLVGADFSNLRDFCLGIDDFQGWESASQSFCTDHFMSLIQEMPRLETLCVDVSIPWEPFLAAVPKTVRWLRCALPSVQLDALLASGLCRQLQWLWLSAPMSNQDVERIAACQHIGSLVGLVLRHGDLSPSTLQRLRDTGVEVELKGY